MKIAIPWPCSASDPEFWSQLGKVSTRSRFGAPSDFLEHPQDFDLVVFCGGADISPELYGHPNLASHCQPGRDKYEEECFDAAMKHGIPMAGSCRGLQLINVLLGGTMVQDLGPYGSRSMMETADGQIFSAASTHHQMVIPPPGAEILAWNKERAQASTFTYAGDQEDLEILKDGEGRDRVIQAVAYPEFKIFGSQFHPEWTAPGSPAVTWYLENVKKYCLKGKEIAA